MWRFARFYKNARSATTQAFFIGDDLPVDGRRWPGGPDDGFSM